MALEFGKKRRRVFAKAKQAQIGNISGVFGKLYVIFCNLQQMKKDPADACVGDVAALIYGAEPGNRGNCWKRFLKIRLAMSALESARLASCSFVLVKSR